jgi:hypothetical protein
MKDEAPYQLTVEENHYRFVWGLVTILSLLTGTVLFDPLQNSRNFSQEYFLIIIISFLFTLGIWGIFKTVQPIYTVFFEVLDNQLKVQVLHGEDTVNEYKIPLQSIDTVTYQARTPPRQDEALYDFATDYLVVYRSESEEDFQPLIDIAPKKMALKIKDIGNIIRFLRKHRSAIRIPENDRPVLGI